MSGSPAKVSFETQLVTSGDKPIYHYLLVEKPWVAPLGFTGNVRRVVCVINGEFSFQCSLMPNGKGAYYISVNKENRTRLGIIPGDTVRVELTRDTSKYGLPMPKELREVLDQDADGDRLFHKLTNGKQRTVLYYVSKQKSIDRRIEAALIIIEHLKTNEGKIDYRKLHEELKRPAFKGVSDELH